MRETWTIQDYVNSLTNLADVEDIIHPDIVKIKSSVLRRELKERFSQEELRIHNIFFD